MGRLLISSAFVLLCNSLFCGVYADVHPALLKEFDTEGCQKELRRGLRTLIEMSDKLVVHESERRTSVLTPLKERASNIKFEHQGSLFATDPTGKCPLPMTPIFPPPDNETGVAFSSIFPYNTERDLYINYMSSWAKMLIDEESICGGLKDQHLSSITMEQIYGFLSIFATNYAQPLCPVCKEVVGAFREEVMKLDKSSTGEAHFIIDVFLAHLPSTETLCSILLPSCHEKLLESVEEPGNEPELFGKRSTTPKPTTLKPTRRPDTYNATHCFLCQFCMTGTMLLEHKFLLNQDRVDTTWYLLNSTLVFNLCAELCLAYPPGKTSSNPWFPNGANYTQCMEMIHFSYYEITKDLIDILIPNKFCSGEGHKFCEKYETPNILHCLKAYCMDLQGQFTFLKSICSIIPDHPEAADKYLNIRQPRKQNSEHSRDEL